MIPIDQTLVSDEVAERFFLCHLDQCKGACCVEGDRGAPLEEAEIETLREIAPTLKPHLSGDGRRIIEKQGVFSRDPEGRPVTPTLPNGRCAYAVTDEKNILKCGIEQTHLQGKISFKKPISCHLYPIRITQYPAYDAVNYQAWDICKPACTLGKEKQLPLYVFLKEALIRKYGPAWYEKLRNAIENGKPSEMRQ